MAPEGTHYATFRNEEDGRVAHALQGFPVDGQKIGHLEISASIRAKDVLPGRTPNELPAVVVTLYDEQRRELGRSWLGPWRGTIDWQKEQARIRVPHLAREGILRIGLFGATGEFSVDNVQLKAVPR